MQTDLSLLGTISTPGAVFPQDHRRIIALVGLSRAHGRQVIKSDGPNTRISRPGDEQVVSRCMDSLDVCLVRLDRG